MPITEIAKTTFGDALYANMVMLGALVKATDIVSPDAVEKTIQKSVSAKTVETNTRAFRKGLELHILPA
jgi:2-oxoglutarate ferredoxin oxidoreductase subunit gamma